MSTINAAAAIADLSNPTREMQSDPLYVRRISHDKGVLCH